MKRALVFVLLLTLIFSAFAEGTRHDWYQGDTVSGYFQLESDVYRLYNLDGTLVTNYEWPVEGFELFCFIPFSGFDENGLARIGSSTEHLYGLIDRSGKIVVEPKMDDIDDFSEERAAFYKDDLYGYLDLSGNIAIPAQYEEAGFFSDGLAIVRKNGRYGAIDLSGNTIIEPKYASVSFFDNGNALVSVPQSDYAAYGLISRDGTILLEPVYDEILYTDDGVYRATRGEKQFYYTVQENSIEEIAAVNTTFDLGEYWPNEGEKVPVLDEPATLRITGDLPAIDGATALFPFYSAIAQAVYPKDLSIDYRWDSSATFTYSNTVGAYERLINGKSDVIFVAQPSAQQLKAAEDAGIELELTPLGYEAFVFFVNRRNPMDNITVEQIRSIYSGAITEWDALGYEGLGKIIAYQRPENSGSQTALEKLMGDTPIMETYTETEPASFMMNDIVNVVEYRNQPNAIGYSFRFFLTVMMNSDVKLLSIDGIEPSEENIRNQTYPIIAKIYAVSRKGDDNPNLAALLEWLQGEQGMELVRKSGYIPYTIYEEGKIVENLIP